MSYQGYQNVPADEQVIPNDMTNPNQQHQQQPPPQQTYHVSSGPPVQQQSFQGGPPQPQGATRAYMPTYHEYMQHNSYEYVSQGGFGNYTRETPFARDWCKYSYISKRRKMLIVLAVSVILLFIMAHPSPRNVNSKSQPNVRPGGTGTTETPKSDKSGSSGTGSNSGSNSSSENKGIAGDGTRNYNNNDASNIPPESTQENSSQNGNIDNGSSSTDAAESDTGGDSATTGNEKDGGETNGNSNGNSSSNTLKIAYLLTYPMSGTTYTKYLIEKTTNTTVATNSIEKAYLNDQGRPIRVFPTDDSVGSPLWTKSYGTTSLPQNFVVTLSHCSGYCLAPCQPDDYIKTEISFEESCRTIIDQKNKTMHLETKITPKSEVAKIIHLIRDPFSNVVSRFHQHMSEAKVTNQRFPYTHDKNGFRAWCATIDAETEEKKSEKIGPEVNLLLREVPCRSEFYKYIAWHNHVVEMIWTQGYGSINIYYEDYLTETKREDDAVKIGEFLDLETVDVKEVPGHLIVRLYRDYFTEDEIKAVKNFVQEMAFTTTRGLLARYFV